MRIGSLVKPCYTCGADLKDLPSWTNALAIGKICYQDVGIVLDDYHSSHVKVLFSGCVGWIPKEELYTV